MTSVKEVRDFLNKMGENRVREDTVELMLRMAKIAVDNEKSSVANNDAVEAAVLSQAAWMSYLAYATEVERSVGEVPPSMLIHLEELKMLAERYMGYAKRGLAPSLSPLVALSKSTSDIIEDLI